MALVLANMHKFALPISARSNLSVKSAIPNELAYSEVPTTHNNTGILREPCRIYS